MIRRETFWRTRFLVIGLAAFAFAASITLHGAYFSNYSGDADEGAYVLQARMLQEGNLTLSSDIGEFFRPWLTGERDGHLFTQYLPGWPAVIAASDWVFGTMAVAPAAMAAAWVLATYGLTIELLKDRRVALVAAGLIAFCPLVLLHGAVFLSYAYSAAALTGGAACIFRGDRTGRASWLVAGGAAFGAALLARPFDVVLFGIPVAMLLAWQHRHDVRRLVRIAAIAGAGALPFVVVLLAYNAHVTGAALELPLAASDPLNKFGFGERRILPDQALIAYPLTRAWRALRMNTEAVPSWLFGGLLLVVFAAIGALMRRHRPARLFLVALVVVFPAGYLFWWATRLSAVNAVNGIGPHYYLPILTPIAALAASALLPLWSRSRVLAVAMLVALVAATIPSVGPKLDAHRDFKDQAERTEALIPDDLPTPAAIVVRDEQEDRRYVGVPYPFLANDPSLIQPVLYAAPRGPVEHRLASAAPSRHLFRLDTNELHDAADLFGPRGTFIALSTVRGQRITLHVHIRNDTDHRYVTAYAGDRALVLDTSSTRGSTYDVQWTLSSTGAGDDLALGDDRFLVVGTAMADHADLRDAEQWEERISAGPVPADSSGAVEVQLPGYRWRRIAFPEQLVWLPGPVAPTLRITARPTQS